MIARELDRAAALLEQRRSRAREYALIAAAGAVVTPAVALVSLPLATAAGGASLAALVGAVWAFVGRRDLIKRLALDPGAYELPDVRSYADRLARKEECRKLARWLMQLIARAAADSRGFYIADRVRAYAPQLEDIASKLAAPGTRVEPISAVTCYHLLTRGAASPLYNPRLPTDDLNLMIHRILVGIDGTDRLANRRA